MSLFNGQQVQGNILILGDSITDDGRYVSYLNAYLRLRMPEKKLTFYNLGLSSENLSGLTEDTHPFHPRPCLFTRLQQALAMTEPDWIFSFYGINDAIYRPFDEANFEKFKEGYLDLAQQAKAYGAKLIAITPIPFDTQSYKGGLPESEDSGWPYQPGDVYAGYNQVMRRYAAWMMEELPAHCALVVDLFTQMEADRIRLRENKPKLTVGDGIHPDDHGHIQIASILLNGIFGACADGFEAEITARHSRLFRLFYKRDLAIHRYYKETVGHGSPYKDKFLTLPNLSRNTDRLNRKIERYVENHPAVPFKQKEWHGFPLESFYFNGSPAVVVVPKKGKATGKWVWRTEFFGAFPQADIQMLEEGCHLVFLAMHDQFGSDKSVEQMRKFYDFITNRYPLNKKMALFGFSRGGLYALRFAADYPGLTDCMYLDAPVVDICSWPMGKGAGCGSPADALLCLDALGLTRGQLEGYQEKMNGYIACAAGAGIPLVLCAGTNDDLVPYSENGQLLETVWNHKKAPLHVILKPGVGHHPHSLKNPEEITSFLLAHMGAE